MQTVYRSGKVWNCLLEHSLSRSPGINHKIRVFCPRSTVTKPSMLKKALYWINQSINFLLSKIVTCVLWIVGSKGMKLLAQKIPATYKQLEDVVGVLSEERKLNNKDPVLHAEQYK